MKLSIKNTLILAISSLSLIGLGIYLYVDNTSAMFENIQEKNTLKIQSPGFKNRKTAKLKLKNGLRVYLISDPAADKSAASISMEVGSWQDPIKYPGMAHFCEHLLFMGTKKYPKEHQFQADVKAQGGLYNAYTSSDRTVYMFTSNHTAFNNILDQFAHFFIDPLFNPSGVARELHAVDQENAMYSQNDYLRSHMVFKEMGNPNHPNALFNIGNLKTLGGIPVDEVKSWYEKNYSSHKANLVLYSPLSIKELTQLAVAHFSDMHALPKSPKNAYLGNLTSERQKAHITYIKTIKDMCKLTLTWELPATYSSVANKIPNLIAYVLNSKGKNSLYHQLKIQHIAENVHVSINRIGKVPIFQIDITFIKNQQTLPVEKAIEICFQALATLKSTDIPTYIFEEMQAKSNMQYSYQAREDAFNLVMKNAAQLIDEELATYPLKTVLGTQAYKKEAAQAMLDLLVPNTCVFEVMAPEKKVDIAYDKKEQWYGTDYAVKAINKAQIKYLDKIVKHVDIGLPAKNPFIPVDFHLKHQIKSSKSTPAPLLLENTKRAQAFFYPDDRYSEPKVSLHFGIKSNFIDGTAKGKVLLDLYTTALKEAFLPIQQQASEAGIHCFFYLANLKLNFCIQGYNEKAHLVLDELLNTIAKCMPSKHQFEIYRNQLAKRYENHAKSRPAFQAYAMCAHIISNAYPTQEDCLKVLRKISYQKYRHFLSGFSTDLSVEGFFAGNLKKEEAIQHWGAIKKQFLIPGSPDADRSPTEKILILPQESGPYKTLKNIPIEGHALYMLLQGGKASFEKKAAMQILNKAFQDAYFSTLRTKQQIAYALTAYAYEKSNQLLHIFYIESSTHNPEELLARTEAFLEDYVKDFQVHLPKTHFEKIRTELITSLQTPPPNLAEMSEMLHQLAFEYRGDFGRITKQIDALQKITYQTLKSYAFDLVARQNKRRLACLVHGKTAKGKDFNYTNIDSTHIKKMGQYVS